MSKTSKIGKDVLRTKNLWPAIRANLRLAQASSVAIGFPGTSVRSTRKHPGGNENYPGTPLTMVEVALRNEFGTAPGVKPGVIARPFVKTAMQRHGKDLMDKMVQQHAMIAKGEQSTTRALSGMGRMGVRAIQGTITDAKSWAAPNPDHVQAKKRSTSPLIDTGAMRQAVTHRVDIRVRPK